MDGLVRNVETAWCRSMSYLQRILNNNDTALEYLNILAAKNLASARDWLAIGTLYEQKKDWEKAACAILQAVEKSARHPQYVYYLARVEEKAGNLASAENMYSEALGKNENLIEAIAAKGLLLYKKGAYHEAAAYLRKCAAQRGKDASLYNNLGLCLLRTGECEEGLRCLRTAVSLEPEDDEIAFNLASALIKNERYSDAVSCLNKIKNQADIGVVMALAYCHGALRDYEKSLALYYKALTLSGDNREILINIASIYAKSGRLAQSLSILSKLITVDPYDAELLNNLAWVYEKQHDYDRAETLYYRGLAVSTGDPSLAYNLICCLKTQKKYLEALDLTAYLKKAPEWQGLGWSVMAQIYEQFGANNLADDCYNKALGLE